MEDLLKLIDIQVQEGFHHALQIKLVRPGIVRIGIPYYYPDGDQIELFIQPHNSYHLLIVDMGMTLMRLSYEFSIDTTNKRKILHEVLANHGAEEIDGNIKLLTPINQLFPYLMEYVQIITRVSDISYLKRETVKSLFYEYFNEFVTERFKGEGLIKDFYPDFDQKKQYPTPYALVKPLIPKTVGFYPIASDDRCNETTITIQYYELHKFHPHTIAVFENQVDMSRKPLARLTDSVEKQFSALSGNEDKIIEYAHRYISQ